MSLRSDYDLNFYLGRAIRSARRKVKLTQLSVALAMETTQQHVSRWEQGAITPCVVSLMRLGEVVGVPGYTLLRVAASFQAMSGKMAQPARAESVAEDD